MFQGIQHVATATMGVKGRCVQCNVTLELKAWQLNAIAIDEPFACLHCRTVVHVRCARQQRQFKSLDGLALLKPGMLVLVCVALLVALVAEWVGLIGVVAQFNLSLIAVFLYFAILRYASHKQRMILTLHAANSPMGYQSNS